MEFSSAAFIWLFLPAALVLCCLTEAIRDRELKIKVQNCILLLLSLFFYQWGGGLKQLLLFVLMILMNYAAGLWIGSFKEESGSSKSRKKLVFILSLLADLSILAFFKYFNMMKTLAEILMAPKDGLKNFLISLMKFEGTGALQLPGITMPLAISFTVFQSVSYLTDVYRGTVTSEKDPVVFSLFLSFFARLTQGPIMRFGNLEPQIRERSASFERFASGVRRFCYGLGKKVIIANTVAAASNQIWATEPWQICTAEAWLGVLLYTLQIYYDFSGYSDMAVGVGKMFGFELCENFNYPYTALSVQEFWRRWHMSLSTWFRDYIYIPLGGSRRGTVRTLFNLSVVFLVTGIWHGADLTFLCWGAMFAVLMVLERLFLGKLLKKNPVKLLNRIYTLFFVGIGWVLFRSPNLYHAWNYMKALFIASAEPAGTSVVSYFSADLLIAVLAGVLLSGMLQRPLQGIYDKYRNTAWLQITEAVVYLAIFVWSMLLLLSGSYNPSIYGAF